MDKVDEFLERTGIELLPYQKEVLQHIANGERGYVIFPYRNGRDFFYQSLLYLMPILLSKGENDGWFSTTPCMELDEFEQR